MSSRGIPSQGCFSQMNNPHVNKVAKRLTYDSGDKPKQTVAPLPPEPLAKVQAQTSRLSMPAKPQKQELDKSLSRNKDLSKNKQNNHCSNTRDANLIGQQEAELNRLRVQTRRLRQKVKEQAKQIEGYNEQVMNYEDYAKQMEDQLSKERVKFKSELQELRSKLSSMIQTEKENARLSQQLANIESTSGKKIQEYEYLLHECIMFVMSSFSQITHLREGHADVNKSTIASVSKSYIKVFKLLNPLIEEWGIEDRLKSVKTVTQNAVYRQAIPQKHSFEFEDSFEVMDSANSHHPSREKQSTTTTTPGIICTDRHEHREQHLSTNNDHRSFESTFDVKNMGLFSEAATKETEENFEEQGTYRVAKSYQACNQNHLKLQPGDMLKVLKKNRNSLWIGEVNDAIGYFPYSCLQKSK